MYSPVELTASVMDTSRQLRLSSEKAFCLPGLRLQQTPGAKHTHSNKVKTPAYGIVLGQQAGGGDVIAYDAWRLPNGTEQAATKLQRLLTGNANIAHVLEMTLPDPWRFAGL